MSTPILVLTTNQATHERETQLQNIQAGRTVADVIRTTLGPKSMLKMILDPMGGIVLTNDGNAILREIEVKHPAAKTMIELSRAQDEEVGDGTTTVVILAGELLSIAEPFLMKNMLHPIILVRGYQKAMESVLEILADIAVTVDEEDILKIVTSSLRTKFTRSWGELIAKLALYAAKTVACVNMQGRTEIDIKRYVRVEKIPGGSVDECDVLNGVMINKDITHAKMRRYIEKPRVVLLDAPLEYKKGESMTNIEIVKEEEWEAILKSEEDEVKRMCDDIINIGCDVLVTEKGVSDLAAHFLLKAGISVIRRVRKMDNNRIARVTGATIINQTEELTLDDVGKCCGLFKVDKIGDEYFTYFVDADNPKACTVVLRGSSKDVLNEIERNFTDAIHVARNLLLERKVLPGGGGVEMEIACQLAARGKGLEGHDQWLYQAVSSALEVIPRTIAANCGVDVVRTITELRMKHQKEEGRLMGINGVTGKIENMFEAGVYDAYAVKLQTMKTAFEAAAMILKVDQIVSGQSKKVETQNMNQEDPETFGDSRDG